jgi:hypothetical protein
VLTFSGGTESEGVVLPFTVTSNRQIDAAVTVSFSTLGTGTATAGSDFTAQSSQTVTLAAMSLTATQNVTTAAENLVEANETVDASITSLNSGGRNVILSGSVATLNATGTINNDDSSSITITGLTAVEGNGGGSANLNLFQVNLTNPVDVPMTVSFSTTDGSATSPADFASQTNVTVNIPANSSGPIMVPVSVVRDAALEGNETLTGTISNLVVAARPTVTLGGTLSATGTIQDDDAATTVSVAVAPASANEDGAGTLVYTFTRVGDTVPNLTVNFNVSGAAVFGAGNDGDSDH